MAEIAYPASHPVAGALDELIHSRAFESIKAIVTQAALKIAQADGVTIAIRQGLEFAFINEQAIKPSSDDFLTEVCLSGLAMVKRLPVTIYDLDNDPRVVHAAARDSLVKSAIVVPIRQDDPTGALGVYWRAADKASAANIGEVQLLADTVAEAIDNINLLASRNQELRGRTDDLATKLDRLRMEMEVRAVAEQAALQAAGIDELTGLLNRRGLMARGQELLTTLRQAETEGILCMLDLDRFKQVNDRFGHEAGDRVLRIFADALGSCVRQSDLCARLGGDEFVILAVTTDIAGFVARLTAHLNDALRTEFNIYKFGVSIGLTRIMAADDRPLADLMANADRRMYQAKIRGTKKNAAPARLVSSDDRDNRAETGTLGRWMRQGLGTKAWRRSNAGPHNDQMPAGIEMGPSQPPRPQANVAHSAVGFRKILNKIRSVGA